MISKNHDGKQFGLYRAKQTRFAGKFREMSRLLKVRADLQEVVVSREYAQQKVSSADRTGNDDDTLQSNSFSDVKAIVLDDDGFWTRLVQILRVAMPVLKLL